MDRTVDHLVDNGKLVLPCGEFTVVGSDDVGMTLKGKRGGKKYLTYSRFAKVIGKPGALVFSVHDHRRDVGRYALTTDGTLIELA